MNTAQRTPPSLYTDKEIQYAVLGLILLPLYIKLMSQLSMTLAFPTVVTTSLYYGTIWLCIAAYIYKNPFRSVVNLLQIGIPLFLFCAICSFVGTTGSKYIFKFGVMEIATIQTTTLFFTGMFMVLGLGIQDYDSFSRRLHMVSRVCVLFGALIFLLIFMTGGSLRYDDMTYAYGLCLPICLLLAQRSKYDLPFILIGVFCLFSAGTRGPLVCVVVAYILTSFVKAQTPVRFLINLLIGVLLILSCFTGIFIEILKSILEIISNITDQPLRILDHLNAGELSDSSGRDYIAATIRDAISHRFFMGYGIGGDRYILGYTRSKDPSLPHSETYCHNIALELFISLGAILGTIVLLWILYRFFKMFVSKDNNYRTIAIAFFSGQIVKLCFSSSLLNEPLLFVFLGMSIATTGILSRRPVNPEFPFQAELEKSM